MIIGKLTQPKRFYLAALAAVILLPLINACTVKRTPVQFGFIPMSISSDPEAEEYGDYLFQELLEEFDLDPDDQKRKKLVDVFYQLTQAAGVDRHRWHIYLLNGPDIADIRAVHGNHLFVWSGVLKAVDNDDELAGLLAVEMSHVLAHHTDPVQFTMASDILFNAAELATSFGLLVASQGAVAIGGTGWLKWAYVEASDLDALDRKYSNADEREAANIAMLILSRSAYSPQALVDFWKRAADGETGPDTYDRLSRGMSPLERSEMLEEILFQYALWEYR